MWSEQDADRRCRLPPDPDALPRVLTRGVALERGLSRQTISRRLASGAWRRILPHTYLTVPSASTSDRLAAAIAYAGDGAALSGAAALWASDVRRVAEPQRVLVLVPQTNCATSRGWLQVRRTARPIVAQRWYGPRRVEIARAAADLALTLSRLDDVRALVARVVQDQHCTVEELRCQVEQGPRRGSAHLRTALAEVGAGAASAPEARAARVLRRGGITGFVPNARIRLRDGSVRVVDFFWPELRACLEIDSFEFHFDRDHWAATMDRHLALTADGYSVVHRPPSALHDADRFVADVQHWLDGRAAELAGHLPG